MPVRNLNQKKIENNKKMKTIDALHKKWQDLQPLSPENQKRLDQKFMLEFNYNSNHIEGNTLTYGQTRLLLMFGETSGNARLRDYEEMKAHNVGLELVKREAKDKERPLTENFIRELNRTILVEDFYKTQKTGVNRYEVKVGRYKTRPNSVITATGEMFDYASPEETPAMMTDLTTWYNEEEKKGELSPIQLATLLHYRYIRIHPFEDGNGRIARLLENYVLMRHGFPMIIVQSKDKENYLNALHKCDVIVGLTPSDGARATLEQTEPFLEYMEYLAEHALKIAIKAGKGEGIEEEDDFAKRIALLEREARNKKGQVKFSEMEVWNVLEYFYFPVEKKITEALKPSVSFFSYSTHSNRISKSAEKTGSFHLNYIYRDTANHQIRDFVSNAKSFFFEYELKYPKQEYKIGELDIEIEFHITFEDKYYMVSCLNDKRFNYGSYPSEEETDKIVSRYKTEVLDKIEQAIHDAK
jgi:Fic family protein